MESFKSCLRKVFKKFPMLILADVMVFSVILQVLLLSTLSFRFCKAAHLFVIPNYSSILCTTHATSNTHFILLSLDWHAKKHTDFEGSHYAVFSSILLFLPLHNQTFSSLPCSQTTSILFVSVFHLYMPKIRWKCSFQFTSYKRISYC